MDRDQYGVWVISVPPKSPGECAIPHDSKIKVDGGAVFSPPATHVFCGDIDGRA